MIASRLQDRRPAAKDIVVKDISGTQIITDLAATHQQVQVQEGSGPLGEVSSKIKDLFFFPRDGSSFPAVLEKYIIEWNGVDYEVTSVRELGQLANKLRVETERVR